jgi:hypothetical protein
MTKLKNVFILKEAATLSKEEIADLMQAIQQNPSLEQSLERCKYAAQQLVQMKLDPNAKGSFRTMSSTAHRVLQALSDPSGQVSKSKLEGLYGEVHQLGSQMSQEMSIQQGGIGELINEFMMSLYELVYGLANVKPQAVNNQQPQATNKQQQPPNNLQQGMNPNGPPRYR